MKRKISVLLIVICTFCCYGMRPESEVIKQEFSEICADINCLSAASDVNEEVKGFLQQYQPDANTIQALEEITNEQFGRIPEFFEFQSIILTALGEYKK